jgi:hypothetical protein
MGYLHGIFVVNRPDLLQVAVESVRPLWPFAFILDNSRGGEVGSCRRWPLRVVRPSVPLSTAQSMNYLYRLAREAGAEVFSYQHNDAEALPGSAQAFHDARRGLQAGDRRWAALLTHYDILSAYRTAAVADIGEWDTAFPQPNYHVDNDWFYRARVKGYDVVDSGIPVTHHSGSSTLGASQARQLVNAVTFPMNEVYYERKWGGRPGHEVFKLPWNCLERWDE